VHAAPTIARVLRWVLAVLIAMVTTARADPADEQFRDGTTAMDRNQPRVAAAAFRAAWQLEPRAKTALDLGVALAESGELAQAAEAFETYLADPSSDPAKRPVVEHQLAAWRARLGRIAVRVTPAEATIAIDGVRALRDHGELNVPAAPGPHRIEIACDGYTARELAVVVVAEQTSESREELAVIVTPAPIAMPADPPRASRTPLWIALGTTGLAATAGTVAGIVALERWSTVHAQCPGGVCASPADLSLAHRAKLAGDTADVAFAISGAAAITTIVLWRIAPRLASISISPTHDGAVLGWQRAY
jgi:hypothetical protein